MAKKMVMPFFNQQGGNIHQLCASGHHCQCCLHCPGHFYEATEAEKGGVDSSNTVVSALEYCPVQIAAFLCKWPAKHNMQVLSHHCYSPNIAHADFVLFPKVKDHLDDITLTHDTYKNTWERAIRTLNT
jgi:hypothetical protein